MRFHVLTLFPGAFKGPLETSMLELACRRGLISIEIRNIRDYTHDAHGTADDYQFGGGAGMVLKPEPIFEAVEDVLGGRTPEQRANIPVLLMSPQGDRLDQRLAEALAGAEELVLICGHYAGVDERVRQHLASHEISIGDYVLSGGELAAMVLVEAVARLISGVVGSVESTEDDSFTTGLLQHPQYTRPDDFRGWPVPRVLTSGNHAEVDRWRREESLRRTYQRRPELLESAELSDDDRRFIEGLRREG